MPIAAFLFSLTWVVLGVFLLLLVRVGAKPVPTPASTELRTLSVFRVRCVLGQGHFDEQAEKRLEKRMLPHSEYHLEPLSLKTMALDTTDELQSFASHSFEPQSFSSQSSGSQSLRFTRFL